MKKQKPDSRLGWEFEETVQYGHRSKSRRFLKKTLHSKERMLQKGNIRKDLEDVQSNSLF